MESPTKKPVAFIWILVGSLVGFLLFSIFIYVTYIGTRGEDDAYEAQRARLRTAALEQLEKANEMELSEPGWVDRANGVVRIPLAQAAAIAMPELAAQPVTASSVPVLVPIPAPVETPAPAVDPSAPAAPAPATAADAAPATQTTGATPPAAPAPSATAAPPPASPSPSPAPASEPAPADSMMGGSGS